MQHFLVPVSPGELIDKLTILRIKSERIGDAGKLANIRREKAALDAVAGEALTLTPEISDLWEELYLINCDLWQIEDDIRDHERRGEFGHGFIGLARAVYITNDRRSEVKRKINLTLGSDLQEEKSYPEDRTRP